MAQPLEVQFERMRPAQLREARRRANVAFLPLGTLEWHGVQNPIGLDALKVHHVCCEAARKLAGGAVFPALMLGVPRDSFDVGRLPEVEEKIAAGLELPVQTLRGYGPHGGMDIQEQWLFYQRLVRMAMEQIAGFGFRSIYLCSGHNPLVHWAKPAAVAFTRATKMAGNVVTTDWGGEFEPAGLSGDHGGKWETCLMMAADPAIVDLAELSREPQYLGVASGANAVESTIEQGRAWVDACATALAAEARWMVDNYPKTPARHLHKR